MQPVPDEMAQRDALYVEFLSELADRAAALMLVGPARLPSLDDFRSIVMADADAIRGLFREATRRRLDTLSHDERSALRVLEADPDLLSPLDELRYEPAHSRLMGYFMNRARCPELAPLLVRELLLLAGRSEDLVTDEELANSTVATEVVISDGRLDVCIEGRNCLTYVELKIDSREGRDQLRRYRRSLRERCTDRATALVFLTLPNAEGPGPNSEARHLTLDRLLVAWLRYADAGSGPANLLGRFLASWGRLLGCGRGLFETWNFAEQTVGLNLACTKEEA